MDKSIRREDIAVLYREQHALYAFLVGFWRFLSFSSVPRRSKSFRLSYHYIPATKVIPSDYIIIIRGNGDNRKDRER